jgi:hypothetical protein
MPVKFDDVGRTPEVFLSFSFRNQPIIVHIPVYNPLAVLLADLLFSPVLGQVGLRSHLGRTDDVLKSHQKLNLILLVSYTEKWGVEALTFVVKLASFK